MLKEFYAKAAEATALVQLNAEPEIFDSAYKGMGSENGGVVGMLEVIGNCLQKGPTCVMTLLGLYEETSGKLGKPDFEV